MGLYRNMAISVFIHRVAFSYFIHRCISYGF
ncbi:hypothetical protein CGLO_18123 [Colletotrichum gloeosporioides Cg-14]|uniref:Uncharacterized protein n=1 Tax=Colletotrichum gloeosporioides (strain Cg-14) TaxID=1237896 RepID=T0KV87_COLGC|nr:hypothetical protein CGLO_18123 [Colletotrichum gloeosporioides Cg-14]